MNKLTTLVRGNLWLFLIALTILSSCKKDDPPIPTDPPPCPNCPTITAIVPDHGRTGDMISIQGEFPLNFNRTRDKITVNNVAVDNEKIKISTTTIDFEVPGNCGSGDVIIEIKGLRSDELHEPTPFSYDFVEVGEITPNRGKPGDKVIISGVFFSENPEENEVIFAGGTPLDTPFAIVETALPNALEVIVPENGISGEIKVRVDGHIARGSNFIYEGSVVMDSLSPDHGKVGDILTLHGENFRLIPEENVITFEGDVEGIVKSGTDELLEIEVPQGAQSGLIRLTIENQVFDGPEFTYDFPEIIALEPNHGRKGDVIKIKGKHFSDIKSDHTVEFNGVQTQVLQANNSTLEVKVPDGATTGPIKLTLHDFIVQGPGFIYDTHSVTALQPDHGRKGEEISIIGEFFSQIPTDHDVSFNGVAGTVSFSSANELKVIVPDGAIDGPVSVTLDGSTIQGPNFTYDRPSIANISPDHGKKGNIISINGQFFGTDPNDIIIKFNGQVATLSGVPSENTVDAIVPDGAGTGLVTIEVNGFEVDGPEFRYEYTVNVTTIAGNGSGGFANGTGSGAQFFYPSGVTVDINNNYYVTDITNNRIRKIASGGVVTTFAGTGSSGMQNGTAAIATFNAPLDAVTDNSGNIYVADRFNGAIRKIQPNGLVSTFFSHADLNSPTELVLDGNGNMFIVDGGNHYIIKVVMSFAVHTIFAGSGTPGNQDGNGTTAQFNSPYGITIDANDNLYVSDFFNNNIRKITPNGVVTTLAGNGNGALTDGQGLAAEFQRPMGLAMGPDGNIYVGDAHNNAIRQVTVGGNVSTIAGNGTSAFLDGNGEDARFWQPRGLNFDQQGNLIVVDCFNHSIRKITLE